MDIFLQPIEISRLQFQSVKSTRPLRTEHCRIILAVEERVRGGVDAGALESLARSKYK